MRLGRVAFGKKGEDLACRELERRGYTILARRYRSRMGEIDIVARDGGTLVFVEVKARAGRRFGEAVEAVTRIKRRRIVLAAQEYLSTSGGSEHPCRFDVVAIHPADGSDGRPTIAVYENAFDAVS
jgi:putative endonuclease